MYCHADIHLYLTYMHTDAWIYKQKQTKKDILIIE